MDKNENVIDVIGLIALRKTELYNRVIQRSKELGMQIDTDAMKRKIAFLDNEKFISMDEKMNKSLNPKTTLESLELEIEEFLK